MSYNYDTEQPEWDYEVSDCQADQAYDRQRDATAHFPKDIRDKLTGMGEAQALMVGEQLLTIKKQTPINRGFAESIWGDALGKMPKSFNA